MDNLYERIAYLCRWKGIRPGKLCADLGLSRSLMTDLKMGRKKSIRTETAQRIASYFGVSVENLFSEQQTPPVQTAEIILEQVDVAFYGQFRELDNEDKETVRDMVQLLRRRREARQRD